MTSLKQLLTARPPDAAVADQLYHQATEGSGLHDLVADLVRDEDTGALTTLLEGRTPLHELLEERSEAYGRPAVSLGEPYRSGEGAHTHAARALAAAGLAALHDDDPHFADAAERWYLHCRASSDEAGTSTTLAVTIASLRGRLSSRRAASVGVLLARAPDGRIAELRVIAEKDLPPGIVGHPATMSLFTADDDFRTALVMAYQQTRMIRGAVLWGVQADDGPVDHVVGSSFGAAFAVALDELGLRQRKLTGWLRLRRLPAKTYIVGRLLPSGALGSVDGYDAKTRGLGHRSRIIVPSDDRAKVHFTEGTVKFVRTWRAAAKAARRFDRWAVTRALVALALLLGSSAGVYASRADRARERSERLATASRVAEAARRLVVGGDGTGLLLAMASDDLAASAGHPTTDFEDLSQDDGSLVHIFRPQHGAYRHAALSPDGRLAVIATDAGLVQLVDLRTAGVLWTHSYPPGLQLSADQIRVTAVAFSTDGTQAAIGTSDRKITVLGLREGAWLPVLAVTLDGRSQQGLAGDATSIDAVALGGGQLYAVGPDGVYRYRLADGRLLGRCANPAKASDLQVRGTDAVLLFPEHIDRITVPSCHQRRLSTAPAGASFRGVAADKSGKLAAVATHEAQLLATQPNGTSIVLSTDGPYDDVHILNTNRGIRVTATRSRDSGTDGTYVWDVARNTVTSSLDGYGDLMVGGEHLLWLHDGVAELHSSGSDTFAALDVFDQPDLWKVRWAGPHLLVNTVEHELYALTDVRTRRTAGRVVLLTPDHSSVPPVIAGDPDGKFAAAIAYIPKTGRQLIVWELPSGRRVNISQPPDDTPHDLRFVGGHLYVAYASGTLRDFWPSPSGWTQHNQSAALGSPIMALHETPDGKHLIALSATNGQYGSLLVTNFDAGNLSTGSHRELDGPVSAAAMDLLNDGRIVVAYGAGTVVFLQPDLTIQRQATAKQANYILDVTAVPGLRQVIVSSQRRAYVYDTGSYAEISDLYWDRAGGVTTADVSPDGSLIAAGNFFRGDISLWPLRPADRRARACRAIGRDLTPEEWTTYVGPGQRYRSVCPASQTTAQPDATPPVAPVVVSADHIGPYRLGMTLDDVRAAADVPLDHDEHCGFYTFRGSESFGVGDGPTFFFDATGRLEGMLVGSTVFGRQVRTDDAVGIGTPYADLRARYGARLMPEADASDLSTIWVNNGADETIAFDLNSEQRVSGFRIGPQSFVTSSEFCG